MIGHFISVGFLQHIIHISKIFTLFAEFTNFLSDTPSNIKLLKKKDIDKFTNYDLDFTNAKVVHPELLLLVFDLLGNSCQGNQLRKFDSEGDLLAKDIPCGNE